MAKNSEPRLTSHTAGVLHALLETPGLSGAQISRDTGLPSGTLYPILIRLEDAGWVSSEWEAGDPSELKRPRRRYYKVTGKGAAHAREQARRHLQAMERLAWN